MTETAKILVVDDESIIVTVTKLHLRAAGFRDIVGTTDPSQAMELVQQHAPDLVLLDLSMPGVSGIDILQELRTDARHAQIPVLIVTASSSAETRERALSHGAAGLLVKPVEAEDLVAAVRETLADVSVAS